MFGRALARRVIADQGTNVLKAIVRREGLRVRTLNPWQAKSGQPVALPDVTVQELERQYVGRGEPDQDALVIQGPYGGAAVPDTVTETFRRLARRVGFPDLTLRDLRHTHGSLLLASGANLKVVQERLRHANISTTADRYLRVLPGIQEDAVESFEERLAQEGDRAG